MTTVAEMLATLKTATLVELYNGAVDDYAPGHFNAVSNFKDKATAIERIENMCRASSLAVSFNGDTATIIDAMEAAPETPDAEHVEGVEMSHDAEGDDAEGGDFDGHGDGEGDVAPSGFKRASDTWLKANARGTEAREEYRKARRKAARIARKAARAAKEAAREMANA